jgi:hypothetical protein
MDILSNLAEAPRADPHAGCCGGWGLNTPGYPIRRHHRATDGGAAILIQRIASLSLRRPTPPRLR